MLLMLLTCMKIAQKSNFSYQMAIERFGFKNIRCKKVFGSIKKWFHPKNLGVQNILVEVQRSRAC